MSAQFLVEERTHVAQLRRESLAIARRVAIDQASADRLALAVTEAGTNLVKYGSSGKVLVTPIVAAGGVGVEVIAIDLGPGMPNVAASMRDGHSTAGGPGLGLGSISRIATNLDIYSQRGAGTVLRFEIWDKAARIAETTTQAGGVCVAKPGESAAGDAWSYASFNGRHRALVVDGLGHGSDAAAAAQTALRVAEQSPALDPASVLQALHAALRSTRGAAAATASVTPHASTGTFAGIGNIRAFVRDGTTSRHLVSHTGTLGHQVRKFQPFDFAFPAGALLLMHSDGIATHWDLDQYPGLERHHPAVIAAAIYRDHARGNDDATVVVVRNRAECGP